jgi:DNA-directed RNA polymerase specialized sigma24 family protein
MKIPDNLTEQEVFDTISLIVDKIAPRYTFHGYEIDDIKQESFIICLDALDRYDCKRPLENFLSVHLSNRLKNFIRDNHYLKDNTEKKKIKSPNYISDENYIKENFDIEEYLINKEILQIIDEELPSNMREDYLKMINGVSINKNKKEKIINKIKEILKDA